VVASHVMRDMKRAHATILMAIVGVLAFLAIVGLSLGAWAFAYVFDRETANEMAATVSFAEVRQRFAGAEPVLDVADEWAVIRRDPPAGRPDRPLERLLVMVWDPDDENLARVTLPFWLLRLKKGPLDLAINRQDIDLTVEQIERYGPTLLVDHVERGGDRLLIWTE
jgi:hypothetical protein